MALHIFRVTVRGFFDQLDDAARDHLLADVDRHGALDAAFTETGTLTYDRTLAAFSFRYQLRVDQDDDHASRDAAHDEAVRRGTERALATLAAAGIGSKRVRVTASNMADVWASDGSDSTPAERRQR